MIRIENKVVQRQSAIAEFIDTPSDDYKHPYLTSAKFVFTDDKPNGNNQAVDAEDFDSIIKSAVGMPIKMSFTGSDVGHHRGAYIIGFMKNLTKNVTEDGTNQLIADAALYSEEFPEEVSYLKEAFAKGDAPGVSYEMGYSDPIFKNGVEFLKNIVTGAATFVKFPAYGKRTALLALASAKDEPDFINTMKALVAQAEGPNNKGGKSVEDLDKANRKIEELEESAKELKTQAETKTGEVARLTEELGSKDAKILELEGSVAKMAKASLLETRTRQYTEAGLTLEAEAEKADKKKEFWLSLSDDAWTMYLDEIKSAKASAVPVQTPEQKALAGLRTRPTDIPKPDNTADNADIPSFSFR